MQWSEKKTEGPEILMDAEERARRRRHLVEGWSKIAYGLIRILFIGLLIFFTLKYFAK